jgi:hypothetical protein
VRETNEALRTGGEEGQTPGRSLRPHFPLLEAVLTRMLEERGLRVERQVSVAFDFNGMHFDEGGDSSMRSLLKNHQDFA